MAVAALEQVLAWDVKWIQDAISKLTSRAENGAAQAGAMAVAGRDRVGHLIGIRPRGGVRGDLVSALAAANVYVSVRGDGIRVAPHVFNTEGDIDRLVDSLRKHS
jgi:selenocysteine lyase/cysteine desulfurase